MAATEGQIGYGTLIKLGDAASPEVFTTIGELFTIGPVGAEKPIVDFTHHESPNKFKEFRVGIAEGVEVVCNCNFIASNVGQDTVRTFFDAEDPINFQVVGPAGTNAETAAFSALITQHDVDRPLEDRQTFNFTIKITSSIVYT